MEKEAVKEEGEEAKGKKEKERPRTRRVHFPSSFDDDTAKNTASSSFVTLMVEADSSYDRTAVESDIFSCDVCGIPIPSGIRGYEPYGTCLICPEGFDVCGSCCGSEQIMRICHNAAAASTSAFNDDDDDDDDDNNHNKPTIRVSCHKHVLTVVDRKAEILWANEGCCSYTTSMHTPNKMKKNNTKATSTKNKKKKQKQKESPAVTLKKSGVKRANTTAADTATATTTKEASPSSPKRKKHKVKLD